MRSRFIGTAAVAALLLAGSAGPAGGDEPLRVLQVLLDPPTLHTLGVQMLIEGDPDRDATVSARSRRLTAPEDGEESAEGGWRGEGWRRWREGPPLFRVFPETVTLPVPEQLAGSIFDLAPDTAYEIELRVSDPDRGEGAHREHEARFRLVGRTRPVPRERPRHAREVPVASADGLRSALGAAQPGDLILLADGVYPGSFVLSASGTA
jgi:hypothetical protein